MAYGDTKTKEDRMGKRHSKGVYGDLRTRDQRMGKARALASKISKSDSPDYAPNGRMSVTSIAMGKN